MPEEEFPNLPHDIQAPEDYLPGTPLWIWMVLAVTIVIILASLIFLIKNLMPRGEKTSLVYSKNLFYEANEQLVGLTQKSETMPLALFATSISLILRDCLSKVLNDRALYETDEELALRSASLESVPPSIRIILQKLADAKYAPSFVDPNHAQSFVDEATAALKDFQDAQFQAREEVKS